MNLLHFSSVGGSQIVVFTKDLKWYHFGFWKERFSGELTMIQQSRPLLEWYLQHRIDQVSNIKIRRSQVVAVVFFVRKTSAVNGAI